MRIAVVGAGRVGSGLASRWVKAGHELTLTFSRDYGKLSELASAMGATSATPAQAVRDAEVVLFSPAAGAAAEALDAVGRLEGRVVVDATNFFYPDPGRSGAEAVAERTGAATAKAFNVLFSALYAALESAARPPSMVYAADEAAKPAVEALARDIGVDPVFTGGLEVAREVEAMARLVIGVAFTQGRGPFLYRFEWP